MLLMLSLLCFVRRLLLVVLLLELFIIEFDRNNNVLPSICSAPVECGNNNDDRLEGQDGNSVV